MRNFEDCTDEDLVNGTKTWEQIIDKREENMKRLRRELAHEEIQQRKALAIWAELREEQDRRHRG